MKRFFLLFLYLCASVIVLADEEIGIKITANQNAHEETIINGSGNLSVSATKSSAENDVRISIMIENKDEEHLFFIFNRAFTESDLKKQNIRFDKISYGSTDRRLRTCNSDDGDDAIQVRPQEKRFLKFLGAESGITSVELPIYIAKYKNSKKSKFLILQRELIHLNVEVEPEEQRGDEDFERLSEAYDDLMSDLEEQDFCPNKRHHPSLYDQEKPFKDKINEIKDEIATIKSENNWREKEPKYHKYLELLDKLNDIDFRKYEKDCRKHKVQTNSGTRAHTCRYSSWTADKVLSTLVQIYRNLDNGKTSKGTAVEKAKAMQREWTNKSCPLYNNMRKATVTKREVEEYYNSIINY